MRAAVLTEFNKDWQIQTLPDPRPAPGQVLIRIHASGMCGTDLHAHHGHIGAKPPIVLGHEPAGEIVELGADEALVRRITRLVDIAEYKRRQCPPGVRVTTKAFGRDRRMPITNGYRA